MDRRSWLWRRKSSEKSPGETDSSGGSLSSHSERFCDDQATANHTCQSPEVTSKAVPVDEQVNDDVKSLTEKLSAALMDIDAKEELVQQHAKVAEEAVSGWEKAESDVLALKQQLDAASTRNAALEDRVGHLDGALKECVRQLRQAREEQERRINEAVAKKCDEWECSKSELESQLLDLKAQLQTTKAQSVAAASVDPDLHPKQLEAYEKQNSALKLELLSRAEELQLRIIERDLSTKAAETASKQHLDSIKKLAKLEAECRRLKAIARKAFPAAAANNDQKSFTDSQSDTEKMMNGCETRRSESDAWASALVTELDQLRNDKAVGVIGRNIMAPSLEINLMDDFLEMERLAAALPDSESGSSSGFTFNEASDQNSRAELDIFIHRRIAQLEEKLAMTEAEKLTLHKGFVESQKQLERLHNQLREAESKLAHLADNLKQAAEEQVKVANMKTEAAESRLRDAETEIKTLLSRVTSLQEEVEKEQISSAENKARCKELEEEVSKLKRKAKLQRDAELQLMASYNQELKVQQDKDIAIAASKLAECQKTIASLGVQLKSLATLEDFLIDSDKPPPLELELVDGEEDRPKLVSTTDRDSYNNSHYSNSSKRRGFESSKLVGEHVKRHPENGSNGGLESTLAVKPVNIASDKSGRTRTGFGKIFPTK